MVYNAFFYQQVNPKIPWNMLVAPSVTLSLFAAAFYFVARGLQDVSDPRKRDNLL
jgi:ABC-type dipeptide/oligopeptide/nickel transport system permease subunit